jgi:hypothetical protein
MKKLGLIIAALAVVSGAAFAQSATDRMQTRTPNDINAVTMPTNDIESLGGLKTAPVSGTASVIRIGGVQGGTVTLVTSQSLVVSVSGTTYKLGIVQ